MGAEHELQALMTDAPLRYRTVRLRASFWVDWALARQSLARRPNASGVSVRLGEGGWPKEGYVDQVYHAWYERPRGARVERYDPPDHLREVSGSTESYSWQYFPPQRRGHTVRHQGPPRDENTWEHLMTFTHEAVPAELLDPSGLWEREGANASLSVTVVGRMQHLGRPALRLHVTLSGRAGPEAWTELLWPADDHEFIVDEATGILLRTACLFEQREFAVAEVFDISLDHPSDRSLFEYRPRRGPP